MVNLVELLMDFTEDLRASGEHSRRRLAITYQEAYPTVGGLYEFLYHSAELV